MKTKEKNSKKLLVEGNDDQHVIWSLCKRYNVNENFDVIDSGGFTALLQQIPLRGYPENALFCILIDSLSGV